MERSVTALAQTPAGPVPSLPDCVFHHAVAHKDVPRLYRVWRGRFASAEFWIFCRRGASEILCIAAVIHHSKKGPLWPTSAHKYVGHFQTEAAAQLTEVWML